METAKRDFGHPYEPYDIQDEMMNAIYDCIAQGQVGIFESPTGTGKSLSLICSSLTWLRDFQDGELEGQKQLEYDDEEPDWVLTHAREDRRNTIIEQKRSLEERLRKIRVNELRQQNQYDNGDRQFKKLKVRKTDDSLDDDGEARFALDEYSSDDNKSSQAKSKSGSILPEGFSTSSVQLMEKLGLFSETMLEEDNLQPIDETKIFYCSRTHSQLTQFVQEIRRVKSRASSLIDETVKSNIDHEVDRSCVKHITLGSRKNLCIHPKIAKFESAEAVNERCLELQKPDVPLARKCQFLPGKENESLVNDFRDHALAKVRDIEDFRSLGGKIGVCPYYATRATIKPSEIVTLPYPLLLQKSAREAFNISLKGHVIIIDEAHNLMDTISNLHSIIVTQSQLKRCRDQLGIYLQKFRNRLKGKNRVYVTQLVRLIDSISSYLQRSVIGSQTRDGILNVSDLMTGKGVDQINLYKLMRYLDESKLARKVEDYIAYSEVQNSTKTSIPHSSIPVLMHVQSFLKSLTNPTSEGQFFYEKDENNEMSLKYMLLDPTHHFREIVEDARAIILAGGTMSPMEDYARHLLAYVSPDRLRLWSCGHVIPKENLTVWPVAKGPNGIELDFTYSKRNLSAIIDELGYCFLNLSRNIPDGMVVFFPSYSYLDQTVVSWQREATGSSESIWKSLSAQKPLFQETKDTAGVDTVLQQYKKAVEDGKGGLLFAVMGGKMSEGINFSDRLGRGVIVVGLPFPNSQGAQWKAKLEHIKKSTIERGGNREAGKTASREFYENACMRAVNQSIGRAIRHRRDFASIILLDRRYRTSRIVDKLPGWIKQGIVPEKRGERFEDVIQSVEAFFRSRGS